VDASDKRIETPEGDRPYSPRSFNRTMKCCSIAKELMQTLPDTEHLYEANRSEEAKYVTENAALGQLHDLRITAYIRKHYRELCSKAVTQFTTKDVLQACGRGADESNLSLQEAARWQEKIFVFNPTVSQISRILAEPSTAMTQKIGFVFSHLNWLDMLRICMVQRYQAVIELECAVKQWFIIHGENRTSSKYTSMIQLEAQARFEKLELQEVLDKLPDHRYLKSDYKCAMELAEANPKVRAKSRAKGKIGDPFPTPDEESSPARKKLFERL